MHYINKEIISDMAGGDVAENLITTAHDCQQLHNAIGEFRDNSQNELQGEYWDLMRERLDGYEFTLEQENKVNTYIKETQEKSAQLLKDAMDPYSSLDEGELSDLEAQISTIKLTIELNKDKMTEMEEVTVTNPETGQTTTSSVHKYDVGALEAENTLLEEKKTELQDKVDAINRMIVAMNLIRVLQTDLQKKINEYFIEIGALPEPYDEAMATAAMARSNLFFGEFDALESLLDGMQYLEYNGTAAFVTLVGKIAGLFSKEDEEALMRISNDVRTMGIDLIATDASESLCANFFENSELGREINKNSSYKYDSEKSITARENTSKATIKATEIALGAVSGPILPAAIGSLTGAGKAAEIAYNDPDISNTSSETDFKILEQGFHGGVTGYFVGANGANAVNNINKAAQALRAGGVKDISKGLLEASGLPSDFTSNGLQNYAQNIGNSVTKNLTNRIGWVRSGEKVLHSAINSGGEQAINTAISELGYKLDPIEFTTFGTFVGYGNDISSSLGGDTISLDVAGHLQDLSVENSERMYVDPSTFEIQNTPDTIAPAA